MPRVDADANARKRKLDGLASKLLDIDKEESISAGGDVAFHLLGPEPVKLFVTGGAGSGKTTIASTIAERLNLPCFNLDEFIPGGYTANAKEYRRRLVQGMMNLWDELPPKGWVVEHVESCNEDMVKAFKPTHCLLLAPPPSRLLAVAHARANAGSNPSELSNIEQRALESAEYARMQFVKAPGKVVARGKNWLLKETG